MKSISRLFALSVLASTFGLGLVQAQDEEAAWQVLFDGTSLENWSTAKGERPGEGWAIEDGTLTLKKRAGDLYTKDVYSDFELELEWKISPAGNSGIKYRVADVGGKNLGPECQVLDDDKHPDSKKGRPGTRQASAFYDVFPVIPGTKKLSPVGEWNKVRIVAKGPKVQHWLNGVMVLEYEVGSAAFKKAVKDSKYKNTEGFAETLTGRIFLQDHSDQVWYRSIRIRKL